MTLLLWIVRALVILFIIRLVVSFVTGVRRAPAQRPSQRRPQERLGGTLVRDPNCGTFIPQERAIVVGSGDDKQFFCSQECSQAWKLRHP